MEYEKFLKGIAWTKKKWAKGKFPQEARYEKLRERGYDYWLHLERKSEDEMGKEVITGFLNKWGSRLDKPETKRGKELKCNLKKAVDQLPDYYTALKGYRIEDIDFQGYCLLQDVEKPILYVIDSIYSVFRQVKPKFGAVPASKLMHMALPNLFIMWDDEIIKEYGIRKQVLPYLGRRVWSYATFLILMQENIHHIKETSPGGSSATNQELLQQINEHCGEKGSSITRLLDIANYAVSRKRNTYLKCHRCIEVARRRLEALGWYVELAKPKEPFFGC